MSNFYIGKFEIVCRQTPLVYRQAHAEPWAWTERCENTLVIKVTLTPRPFESWLIRTDRQTDSLSVIERYHSDLVIQVPILFLL